MQDEAESTATRVVRPVTGLAYRIEEAGQLVGLSRATMFRLIKRGALRAKQEGTATLIRHQDLVDYLDGLPDVDRKADQ